jgi:hypothetical protein
LPEVGSLLAQAALYLYSRQHSSPGVILIGNGGAKQRHETVTQELIDCPLIAVDLAQG